jgi:tetratricopeptide (TPR) repeat protein
MADLSPELASRIQSLEQSYGDNPGRYFVALAGAWREGGDIARAEEILRENLKRFPGLSAHVLLGRCLADRGAFQEAANEFHYVLSIDSQNLIALRTLAEMASAGGRRAEAERWYNELLAVDPMNVEARASLQQLARTPSAPAAPAEPAGPGWGDVEPAAMDAGAPSDGGEFGMIDLSAPDASPADASGVAAADGAADDGAGLEWGDLTLDAPDEAPAPQPAPAAGGDFDAFGFGSVDLDADASASPASPDASSQWMDVDARQDVGESAAEAGDSLPLLDDDLIDAPLAGADLPLLDLGSPADDDALVSPEPGAGSGFGEPADGTLDDVGYVAHEQDGHDADAEMVTETMAELYASQGLLAQAADVYRELIGQRGEEPGLVRRLAEIEARMNPESAAGSASASAGSESAAFPAFATETESEETPDWLQSVDAFARGGTEPTLDAGVPGLDLSPAQTDETFAAESEETAASAGELPSFAAAGDFPSFDPAASDDLPFLAAADDFPSFEPAASDDLPAFAASGELPSFAPPADDALPSFEPAGDFAPLAGFAPEPAGTSASADPFADSFAGGFDGAVDVPAAASLSGSTDDAAGDDRQPWQSPSVAETEPVGFDILVVEDEDGAETPAPADVVADMSADWAMAAAPLDEDLDADDGEADFAPSGAEPVHAGLAEAEPAYAAPAFTAPAFAAPAGAGERTMRGYFDSLLAWQPVPAAGEPAYELSAEGDAITIEAAGHTSPADVPYEAPSPGAPAIEAPAPDDEPRPYETPEPEPLPYESPEPEPLPYEAPNAASFDAPAFPAAPAIPTFDAPSFQPPAQADDEPWAAAPAPAPVTEDEPWAATAPDEAALPGESAPDTAAVPTPDDLPLLDLEEPWAESPAAPGEPVDIGAFELAGDQAEELLPWEMPAEPAAAAAPEPVAEPAAGAFSFEDFFAGSPAESAAPPAVPEPATPAAAEPEPFFPSFAEPTPPPTFEEMSPEPSFAAPAPSPAPSPAPAPAAPAAPAAAGQDEEDEDLESFQAWLQSLKR